MTSFTRSTPAPLQIHTVAGVTETSGWRNDWKFFYVHHFLHKKICISGYPYTYMHTYTPHNALEISSLTKKEMEV